MVIVRKKMRGWLSLGIVLLVGGAVACSNALNTDDTGAPPALTQVPPPHSTSTPIPNAGDAGDEVAADTLQPDPDFERQLRIASIPTRGWNTDFSLHTIPFSEISVVLPRDGIAAITIQNSSHRLRLATGWAMRNRSYLLKSMAKPRPIRFRF